MAVQQNKKSPSKRNMRRSHHRVENPSLSVEASTGELIFDITFLLMVTIGVKRSLI